MLSDLRSSELVDLAISRARRFKKECRWIEDQPLNAKGFFESFLEPVNELKARINKSLGGPKKNQIK